MKPRTLTEIERAIRPGADLLGGDLVRGEVHVDGRRADFHWWNRFTGGADIDLTQDQFTADEVVVAGVVIPRQPKLKRLTEEYELMRSRVYRALGDS